MRGFKIGLISVLLLMGSLVFSQVQKNKAMALSDIRFIKGEGGLGRPLTGEDHISGLVFYKATVPSGFTTTDRVKQIFSVPQAEALGILSNNAYDVAHYHISEYFRLNPKGNLFVGFYDVPTTYDFAEIKLVQNYALGKIRQIGVYTDGLASVAGVNVNALQARCNELFDEHKPLVGVLAVDISDVTDLSTLIDLRVLTANYVSVVIGQDGNAKGKALYTSKGYSIGCIGAALGAISAARVHENIGWVGKFNLAETELDTAAFANGELVYNKAESFLSALQDKGYIFLRKHTGYDGTYFNDSPTAIAANSDYAYIESNRTIDKAVRLVRQALLPELNAPVTVDAATGQLSANYVEYLKAKGDNSLAQMERDGEVSGLQTVINPEQNVLATSTVEVSIENVPVGVSRNFSIKIGFVSKLSA